MKKIVRCVMGVVLVASLTGCSKGLFEKDEPRSQYGRYDELRGKDAPLKLEVPFGQGSDKSALRERLRPMDSQY